MCFQNASPHPTMDSMNSYVATNPVAECPAGGLSPRSGDVSIARPHKCAKRLFVNHAGYCSRSDGFQTVRPTHSCEAALFPHFLVTRHFVTPLLAKLCFAELQLPWTSAPKPQRGDTARAFPTESDAPPSPGSYPPRPDPSRLVKGRGNDREGRGTSRGTPITNHRSSPSRRRVIKVNPSKSSTTFSSKCRIPHPNRVHFRVDSRLFAGQKKLSKSNYFFTCRSDFWLFLTTSGHMISQ